MADISGKWRYNSGLTAHVALFLHGASLWVGHSQGAWLNSLQPGYGLAPHPHLMHDLKTPGLWTPARMLPLPGDIWECWYNDVVWAPRMLYVLNICTVPCSEKLSSWKSFWCFFWETLNTGKLFMVQMGKRRLIEGKEFAHGHTIR